jgi:hypothetical protein
MRNGVVIRSNTAHTSRFSASSAIVATTNSALRVSTAEGAMIGTAVTVLLRSDRVGRFPLVRTAARPALSTGTRKQLSLGGLEATRGPPAARAPAPPPIETPPAAGPQDELGGSPLDKSSEGAETDSAPPAVPPTDGPAEPPQDASAAAATAAKPVTPRRIEMTIDSLPNYDLLQPIPVVIEALDDRMFAAQAPALEISTTGSSIGGSFLQLKEQIGATYEQCRQKSSLTPERLHQIGLFQAYIGKAKRGWSLGRG